MRIKVDLGVGLAICVFLFLGAASTNAQDLIRQSKRSSELFDQCLHEAGIYSREQNDCSFAEVRRQSQLVGQAYRAARNRAGRPGRTVLQVSQRAWKRRTDRKCHARELFGPTALGTIEINDFLGCLSVEYSNRTEWLERRYRR